jgi:hypothetical protein
MRKRSLKAHGLEDTGDVEVRAKVVAGTLSETQTKHLQGLGVQEEKRQME